MNFTSKPKIKNLNSQNTTAVSKTWNIEVSVNRVDIISESGSIYIDDQIKWNVTGKSWNIVINKNVKKWIIWGKSIQVWWNVVTKNTTLKTTEWNISVKWYLNGTIITDCWSISIWSIEDDWVVAIYKNWALTAWPAANNIKLSKKWNTFNFSQDVFRGSSITTDNISVNLDSKVLSVNGVDQTLKNWKHTISWDYRTYLSENWDALHFNNLKYNIYIIKGLYLSFSLRHYPFAISLTNSKSTSSR